MLTFEDFKPGHFGTFGPRHVSRDDIIAFAREYDPQPMHLDEEAAKHSLLRGLAGSGWHMAALMMRMICDGFLLKADGLGSPGVDELRWLAPLRPDSDLMLDVHVLDTRESKSRPDIGIVRMRFEMRDQTGTLLLTMENPVIFRKRAPAGAAS